MAADVSSLVRILSSFKNDRTVLNDSAGPKSTAATLMTRDLLGTGGYGGGGGTDQSLELDLDLEVPNGFEKRLDLKSGRVYLHQNETKKPSSTHRHEADQANSGLQDLNFPPMTISKSPANKPLLSLFDDATVELNLFPSSSSSTSSSSSLSVSSTNSSVCTLDKVKSALERAEKEPSRKRNSPENSVCDGNAAFSSPVAVGCSECLSYVLVMKNYPKCPRCQSFVTLPSSVKKPKIDLNISI